MRKMKNNFFFQKKFIASSNSNNSHYDTLEINDAPSRRNQFNPLGINTMNHTTVHDFL